MMVHWPHDYNITSDWMATHGQTCPGVCNEDGGQAMSDATGFTGGGRSYMFHPDYSVAITTVYGNEEDITSRGIKPHICKKISTVNHSSSTILNASGLSADFQNNNVNIEVSDDGVYQISVFTLNGRLIKSLDLQLNKGKNNIPFTEKSASNNLFVIKINGVSKLGKNYNLTKVVSRLK